MESKHQPASKKPMRRKAKPATIKALEELGRVRLSRSFFMRDFLHSEISNFYGIPNLPDDPDLAVAAGRRLCGDLLEPLRASFGGLAIRSAYRSAKVNAHGNRHRLSCASNEFNRAGHIWDLRDADGCMGATACVVVPWFADRHAKGRDWRALAWWIHDNLPYSRLVFFPKLAAFNINWREQPERGIYSQIPPHKGWLTKPGMDNHSGTHGEQYADWLKIIGP